MCKQISILDLMEGEDIKGLREQAEILSRYVKEKRNWENAFQRWSDSQSHDSLTSIGVCGYGAMCDYCEDNSYGRPCIRALNELCRTRGITINYSKRDFEEIWYGRFTGSK